jgi:hypothetical protein
MTSHIVMKVRSSARCLSRYENFVLLEHSHRLFYIFNG